MTTYPDEKSRLVSWLVSFASEDISSQDPCISAASKCLKSAYCHGARPCRFCHFAVTYNPSIESACCVSGDVYGDMGASGKTEKLLEEY